MQPPKKKEPAKKKFEPIKRKLAWERTYEETDAISKKEVADFFEGLRQARRQRELEEKNKVDPEKLKFFIKMQEETKRKIELKTDYDRPLLKSLQKKRRGGSPNSYIEQVPASTSSADAKKKNQ
jgi:hypothetical protein